LNTFLTLILQAARSKTS